LMPFPGHKHPAWLVGMLCVIGLVVTLLGHSVLGVHVIADLPRHYAIPPTFGNSRLFYGMVLALMMIADALALGATIENVRFLLTNYGGWREPAKVSVINETTLLLAVIFSTVPDVLVLLSWGELMAPPYATLSKWDRAFDGIAALTFLIYLVRRLRSRPALLFQLQREFIPVEIEPSWAQMRPKLVIALVVVVISFGVAFGK
jgi:predicted Co/Zn/Cd cation transporter (cation efflux family)